jgi:SsrA-binding protein
MHIANRDYRRRYQEIQIYEAGMMLVGAEVKSIKAGNIKLETGYIRFMEDGLYLVNAEIPVYKFSRPADYDPFRRRKLLLHKKEILRLHSKLQAGNKLTLVPVACYNKGRHIKLSIALARGKGEIEQKNVQKKEEIKQKQKKEMKEYLKS